MITVTSVLSGETLEIARKLQADREVDFHKSVADRLKLKSSEEDKLAAMRRIAQEDIATFNEHGCFAHINPSMTVASRVDADIDRFERLQEAGVPRDTNLDLYSPGMRKCCLFHEYEIRRANLKISELTSQLGLPPPTLEDALAEFKDRPDYTTRWGCW
jgi:DNA primase catalytic subunit